MIVSSSLLGVKKNLKSLLAVILLPECYFILLQTVISTYSSCTPLGSRAITKHFIPNVIFFFQNWKIEEKKKFFFSFLKNVGCDFDQKIKKFTSSISKFFLKTLLSVFLVFENCLHRRSTMLCTWSHGSPFGSRAITIGLVSYVRKLK